MRFSLIVCTLHRCEELARLFDSVIRQRRTDIEVILVDQNTDDRLASILPGFAGSFPIKHVRMEGTGASRARNLGMYHAAGDLITFPDDDCCYLDGYLDAVDQIFQKDPSIDCITGVPTPIDDKRLDNDWPTGQMDIDQATVLNRCQEFTITVRKERLGSVRYNELLGVGAGTLWGAEEAPDFLIRLAQTGARLVYFPRLLIFHPNKAAAITPSTLQRAASYARGRGCLFRLHRFPVGTVLSGVLRPAVGCILYLFLGQSMRSTYYSVTVRGLLRGLFMSRIELAEVRNAPYRRLSPAHPAPMRPLPQHPLV